jgi:hypothetical protein
MVEIVYMRDARSNSRHFINGGRAFWSVKCVATVEVLKLTPRSYDRSCKNVTFLGVSCFLRCT